MATNLRHMKQSARSFFHPFRHPMHEFCLLKHCMVAQGRIGMFLISSMVLLNSCKAPDETTQNPLSNDSITGPLNGSSWRYLALGDSYTIGESVNPALRWPNQLQEELQANMITDAFETVTILATTGWTTSNLSLALANSDLEEKSWDIVSLLIGVNNQYQGASLEEYAAQYENLLQRAIAAEKIGFLSFPSPITVTHLLAHLTKRKSAQNSKPLTPHAKPLRIPTAWLISTSLTFHNSGQKPRVWWREMDFIPRAFNMKCGWIPFKKTYWECLCHKPFNAPKAAVRSPFYSIANPVVTHVLPAHSQVRQLQHRHSLWH